MDSDDNLFQLSDKEMQSAIDDGLILIWALFTFLLLLLILRVVFLYLYF